MGTANKKTHFNNHAGKFERRKESLQTTQFPLVDSDGLQIGSERRLDSSIYLNRIKLQEIRLQEEEFNQFFKK